jgi:chemotaxis signal transduction protein
LSVTDLRNLLQISAPRPTVGEKIIVIHSQHNSLTTSIVVDRVIGIRSGENLLKDSPDVSHSIARVATGVAAFESQPTVLIDTDKLLGCAELTSYT